MKRCPECRRDYYDDTLLYCLEDGNALLEGPASVDEPATAILHTTTAGEAATRAQINTTDNTGALLSDTGDLPPKSRGVDKRLLAGLILLIIVGGAVFGVYKLFIWRGTTGEFSNAANMRITRVTATGKANRAAISPDGNYVVHSMDDAGKQSLWIRQTATGSNVQILAPAAVSYWGITFSRDGNYIYFVSRDIGAGTGTLARIPVLGGAATTLITDVDSPVTFSPDGQQLAFIRWNQGEKNSGLWLANSDGTGERRIAFRTRPEQLTGAPAWSPDSRVIACALTGIEPTGSYLTVLAISVVDGEQSAFTSQRWSILGSSNGRLGWVGADSLVMNAPEQGSGDNAQLWQISYPGGQTHRLTRDLNDYDDVSLTRDGSSLVTVQSDRQTNLWLAREGDSRQAQQLTFGKGSDGEGLCWTPDNKIVYVSQVSGNQEIWIMSAAGGDQKQLTNDPQADILPAVSNDGRYIVFLSSRSGTLRLWRMNIDGSDPKQLSGKDSRVFQPLITLDSRAAIFRGDDDTGWKVPIEGGEPEPAKRSDADRGWAGLGYSANGAGDGIARRNLTVWQGGERQIFEIPQSVANIFPRLRLDGRAVYYVDAPTGVSNIWSYPLDGGQPKQVTNFQSEQIFAFAYSPDGKQIAVTRGSQTNDVVLLRDFR